MSDQKQELAIFFALKTKSRYQCPCREGIHGLSKMQYCGICFDNQGDLARHLLEGHTLEELKMLDEFYKNNPDRW